MMFRAIFGAILLFAPLQAFAATVVVGGQSNGGFGSTGIFEPFVPLTAGPRVQANDTVRITAVGEINANVDNPAFSGPDGVPFDFSGVPGESPLQEAGVTPTRFEPNASALTGYFAPLGVVNAFDIERGGELAASGLFLVGSSLFFTAPSEGQLFFGVNDPRVSNNAGAFTVDIAAVPLPAGAVLLLTALALLGVRRVR